ncbi:hypothetical protein JW948_16910 [bacterium]|nr:hypothetical protein [bacterium]
MRKYFHLILVVCFIVSGMAYGQMTVKNSDDVILMTVNDEGKTGSISMPEHTSAPTSTAGKLYNVDGDLYWNGDQLAVMGGTDGWTDSGSYVYTTTSTDRVGIGTSSPEFRLSLDNDGGIIAKGTYGSGAALSTSGAGTRLIWYPEKAAFRVGKVSDTEWDDANIGEGSMALGASTKASGNYSAAIGMGCFATSAYSAAFGSNALAMGYSSMALGTNASASGSTAVAIGYATNSSGNYAIAMGTNVWAYAYGCLAIGRYNESLGTSETTWISTDPIFEIGIGESSGSRANAMTVMKDGRVGIGTTNPNGLLEVNGGNIRVTGGSFIDDGTPLNVPDYVFETDYQLESIEEHAAFMWEHKHLPAVASARVIRSSQDGYSMSERREQMLEELEKAHIYIEQLYKEIQELKSKSQD